MKKVEIVSALYLNTPTINDFSDTSEAINTLPNNEFLDDTKLKVFAEDKLNVAKITIFLFDTAENTVWKRRKCW